MIKNKSVLILGILSMLLLSGCGDNNIVIPNNNYWFAIDNNTLSNNKTTLYKGYELCNVNSCNTSNSSGDGDTYITNITNVTNINNEITNVTNITTDGWNFVYLTNDFNFASTSNQAISNGTTLSFNFSNGEIYVFDVILFGNWHSTPDIRLRADANSQAIGKFSGYNVEQAQDRQHDIDTTSSNIAMATGNDHVGMHGVMEATSGPGRLQIEIRQNTASASVQRVDKYSYIKYRKIN